MSKRRQFLKQVGLFAAVPWSKTRAASLSEPPRPKPRAAQSPALVLENVEMRLRVGRDGKANSLIHKPTGQECLVQGAGVSMFELVQYRPYDNELQLAYTAKVTRFPADSVRKKGNQLVVSFLLVGYEATVELSITEAYLGFKLTKFEYKGYTRLRPKRKTPVDESLFLQLPVRSRKQLGDWLNVTWDANVAVNVLAADPYTRVNTKPCSDYLLFQAGTVREIKSEGCSAALIVTATENLMDRIAKVEEDYNLPRGVKSRSSKEYQYSYYEIQGGTPENIDRHIQYARQAGFRAAQLYYLSFAQTAGHYAWRPEYPNGMEDLRKVVGKIAAAGMTPGLHFHYNKAHKADPYVTPRPDPRLNLRRSFTLAEAIDAGSATITVEENPRLCTMDDQRCLLRIQNELIEYESYSTEPPYQFKGCKRGALNSQAAAHELSSRVGLLDVDTWPVFVRYTQNTSIQEEVALKLGDIYRRAGFKFAYFDGAEDVPPPYWFTVSRAQWLVYEQMDPRPLFSEGACKSHFSWHILTRGNAFDVFKPEVMKAATRAYPAAEAPRVAKDFTSIDFGWIGYWAPSRETIGTQPDMLEYVTSRAAGWNCPIAIVPGLDQLEAHPRTPDNLEVIRRWEDVRARGWLSPTQKAELRNLDQEHILLTDESGNFELLPYEQIENVAGSDQPARAFIFTRSGEIYVVYWHTSGFAKLQVALPARHLSLMEHLGKPWPLKPSGEGVMLPLRNRLFLACKGLTQDEIIRAFHRAKIV